MKILYNTIKKLVLSCILFSTVNASAQTPQYKYEFGTVQNWIPFGVAMGYDNYRQQNLHTPGDFPAALYPGFVTGVYFKASASTSSLVMNGFQVDMGNTTVTTLAGGAWIGGLTTGRPASTYTTGPLTSGQWFYIPFSTLVYLDPTKPFIIDVRQTGGSGGISAFTGGAPQNSAYAGNVNSTYGNSTTANPRPTSGYANQFGFDMFAGFPCTDTPKTKIKGPSKVCPNKKFTVQPDSFYADATYKWEYSKNGIAWSNFTGVPGMFGEINDSVNDTRFYRLTVTCIANGNLKWMTKVHRVDIAPFYYCYCDNNVTQDAGADIGNVTIINTNKDDSVYIKSKLVTGKGFPIYNNNQANRRYTGYHDSLAWPCLYRDTTYRFIISQIHSGATFQMGVMQAYIDYNRDGLYNPNTERVFVKAIDGNSTPPDVITMAKAIPSNAEIGPTGMRIIISKDTVKGAPCDTLSGGGEVEDYIVEICHRPCDGPVKTGIVSSTDTSMCAGYEYTLTDTTYEQARSSFTRSWQVSGDDISWFNIANSLNKDTLERIFTGQPLYYRLRTICLPTHDTDYSVATKINVKPGYKCYCYSKAVGGKGVDTSDIGGVTIAGYSSNAGGPHLLNLNAVRPRTDFTDIDPVEIYTDSAYKFTVYHTMPVVEHGDSKVTIFMDFNNNNTYEIPDERIYTGYTTIGNHTLVDNVVVPVTAITDVPTGMRVILNNDVGPNVPSDEACGPYTSGETEDYLLIFHKKWGVGISDPIGQATFNVHPNPSTGKFSVRYKAGADAGEIKILVKKVTGQVVQEYSYNHEGGMFVREMDLGNNAAGVYFVELHTNEQKMMTKLVVQ